MLYNRAWTQNLESITNDIESRAIARALNMGWDVIVDSTNVSPKRIEWLQQMVGRNRVRVELVWFDTPFSMCYLRNSDREGVARVPDEVMLRMKSQYADLRRKYKS